MRAIETGRREKTIFAEMGRKVLHVYWNNVF